MPVQDRPEVAIHGAAFSVVWRACHGAWELLHILREGRLTACNSL
jgi:hypothetical protein